MQSPTVPAIGGFSDFSHIWLCVLMLPYSNWLHARLLWAWVASVCPTARSCVNMLIIVNCIASLHFVLLLPTAGQGSFGWLVMSKGKLPQKTQAAHRQLLQAPLLQAPFCQERLNTDNEIDRWRSSRQWEVRPSLKGLWMHACRDGDVGPQALAYAQGLQASFTALDKVYNESSNDDEVWVPSIYSPLSSLRLRFDSAWFFGSSEPCRCCFDHHLDCCAGIWFMTASKLVIQLCSGLISQEMGY